MSDFGNLVAFIGLFCQLPAPGWAQQQATSLIQNDFATNLAKCVAVNHIDICLRNTLEELRARMPTGIPELNLQPSEPLRIDNVKFKTWPGLVQVESEFTDVVVRQLSKFVTNRISANLDERSLFINMTVPEVHITGNYNVRGKVLVVQVSGRGPFLAVLRGVTGVGSASIIPVDGANGRTMSVNNTNIDFDIASSHVKLENLFEGTSPVLARSVNDFLNQNSGLIINEIKPQIRKEVTTLVESVLNDAFKKLPADEFLKKLPLPRSRPFARSRTA